MREVVDPERIHRFMTVLAAAAREPGQAYFDQIEPELYRFPSLDPATFRLAVEAALAGER